LCASKVHIVTRRFDQEPWFNASEYQASSLLGQVQNTNQDLQQTHNGIGSCNEDGAMEDPCPDSEIKQMIHDGTSGTDHGDGLKQV
jgi:hypothetical protein